VLIPSDNEKNLEEVPAQILRNLEVVPVIHMDQVLALALEVAEPVGVDAPAVNLNRAVAEQVRH
jgi:ATP-dependent Lon protease